MGRFNYDNAKLAANKALVLSEIQRRVKEKYPDVKIDKYALEFPGATVYLDIERWGNSETVYASTSYKDARIRQKKNGDYDKLMEQIEARRLKIIQRDIRTEQEATKKKEMSEALARLGFKHDAIYFNGESIGSMSLMFDGTVKLEMNLTTADEVEALLKTIQGYKNA